MDIKFIENKFEEILNELEKEVFKILNDTSLDKKRTNIKMKELVAIKQILINALDSIKLSHKIAQEEENS